MSVPDADRGAASVLTIGIVGAVIALTAFTRDKDRQQALDAGFYDHMSKPVSIDELVATLEALRPARAENSAG